MELSLVDPEQVILLDGDGRLVRVVAKASWTGCFFSVSYRF